MVAYVDGEWTETADARISVLDHGLLYGDGVFEGIRFYAHEPFLLDAHLDRLEASRRDLPRSAGVARRSGGARREAVRRSEVVDGYIRLVVTRGRGALGVSPHTCAAPTLILIVAALSLYPADAYETGIALVTSSLRRGAPDALPAQAKTLNYLTSVLASIEARRQGAEEAILLNGEGFVAECTADNLFVVSGGRVSTPATSHGALAGITRGLVMRLLDELASRATSAAITPVDVWTADELFLTGTGRRGRPRARRRRTTAGAERGRSRTPSGPRSAPTSTPVPAVWSHDARTTVHA